jgi:hypothetical protein
VIGIDRDDLADPVPGVEHSVGDTTDVTDVSDMLAWAVLAGRCDTGHADRGGSVG